MASFNKTSWWLLKIERFDTSNHPAITTKDKKTEEVQLSRDQESKPHPSEGLEGLHMAVEVAAGDQCTVWVAVGGR